MAFQTIRIKNSNVPGKVPTAGQLDTAELVINLKDQNIHIAGIQETRTKYSGIMEIGNYSVISAAATDKGHLVPSYGSTILLIGKTPRFG